MRGKTTASTRLHLSLAPPLAPDPELLHFAQEMTRAVLAGEVVGVAVVVTVRNGNFFVDAFGKAKREPWPQRGFLRALDDMLAEEGRLQKDAP